MHVKMIALYLIKFSNRTKYDLLVPSKICNYINPLSANPEKWSNTLKQIVGNLPTICLSVFDHFVNLAFKGLMFDLKERTAIAEYLQTPMTFCILKHFFYKLYHTL